MRVRRGRLLGGAAVALAAATVAAVVFVGGSDDGSAQLRALEADPMARYVPPDASLERSTARAERSTGTISQAQPAKLSRVFSIAASGAPCALHESIAAGRAAGWQLRETRGGLGATGTKQLGTGRRS